MTTVTITPVSAWTTPLTTTAVNGQASDAATDVVAPIQVLADRCEYLKDTLLGVQPHSASTFSPVALYNFDGNLNATVGSNLTLAHGTARYAKLWKLPGFVFDGDTDLATAAAVPALALTGAMTIMWIQYLVPESGVGLGSPGYGRRIVMYGQEDGAGASEEENTLWSIEPYYDETISFLFNVRWQYGAGIGTYVYPGTAPLWRHRLLESLCHVALTRASDGVTWSAYVNGMLAGTATRSVSDAPTGGTDSSLRLRVGGYNDGSLGWLRIYGFLGSLAIYNTELSAANVLSQYEHCFGNVHGTL